MRNKPDTPAPVELTDAELNAVAAGLNPQPLPPIWQMGPSPQPWSQLRLAAAVERLGPRPNAVHFEILIAAW
jgi:hypothetical protein